MNSYIFFTGRHPELSLAELSSYFHCNDFDFYCDMFVVIRCKLTPKDIRQILNNIGGSLKVAQLLETEEQIHNQKHVAECIATHLVEKFENTEGKLRIGLSKFKIKIEIPKTLNNIKTILKGLGKSVRFVNKGSQNITTDLILREKLIEEKGCEINMVNIDGKICLAETIGVQNIEDYSLRDYEKPGRDARRGMIPPKLAQIMINIGTPKTLFNCKTPPKYTVWDPFCGTGVVAMEALLMGHNAIGSDIDEKAMPLTEKNLVWLYEAFGYNGHATVFQHDASKPILKNIDFNVIATEPLLGPPLSHELPQEKLKKNMIELERLYMSFFRNLKDYIENKNNKKRDPIKIVFIFPCFRMKKKFVFFEKILAKLSKLGYNLQSLISKDLQDRFNIKISERKSIVYSRPNQYVGREICCFEIKA